MPQTGRLVLRGGTVVDGTESRPRNADVIVESGRVLAIEPPGVLEHAEAAEEEDCSGLVVCPGFVDIHTHSDVTRLRHPGADSRIFQGVTTEAIGNCGLGPAPCGHDNAAMRAEMSPIDVMGGPWPWKDFESFLDDHERTAAATNVVALVGHGALRHGAGTAPADPGSSQSIKAVCRLADRALEAGAAGVSLGLMYSPGEAASKDELVAVAERCSRRDGLLAAHLRHYTIDDLGDAVDELLEIGRLSGARVQLSHLRSIGRRTGRPSALSALQRAEQHSTDVAADAYPYTAGHTTLIQLVSPDLRRLGLAAVLDACHDDPAQVAEAIEASPFEGSDVVIARAGEDVGVVGRTLSEYAADVGGSWGSVAVDLLADNNGAVDVIVFGSTEEEAAQVLAHPMTMIGSDGIAVPTDFSKSLTHPRSMGTFPRALELLAESRIPIETAVAKATSRSADRLGLRDRGRLVAGAIADIVVFDTETFKDQADYLRPLRTPTGLKHVYVAGRAVVHGGKPTGELPGALIRINNQ